MPKYKALKNILVSPAKASRLVARRILGGNITQRASFLVVFAAIGTLLLFAAHAATTSSAVFIPPQKGALSGGTSLVTDPSAISGHAVRFNSNSSGAGTGSGTTGSSSGTETRATPSGRFGMALGSGYQTLSSTQLNSYFADMASMGVQWIRFDIEWSGVQAASNGTYNWTPYDNIAKAAQAHKLNILGILDAAPKWAQQSSCAGQYACPPNGTSAFATYAAAAATHYASLGVTTWEIYNEENNSTFWQTPNTAAYTALLKAAYTAIHQVSSSEFVVSGGLAPAGTANGNILPNTYVQQMYAAGAHGYFDALGDHPYCYSDPVTYCATTNSGSTDGWGMLAYGPNNIRSIMQANGDSNKQIWMTEFGAPAESSGYPYTLAQQSQILQQAYTLTANQSWAGPLFWYSYTDGDPGFGLLDANGNHKPAYSTYMQMAGK